MGEPETNMSSSTDVNEGTRCQAESVEVGGTSGQSECGDTSPMSRGICESCSSSQSGSVTTSCATASSRKRKASKRTLEVEYWDRSSECKRRKREHMDRPDDDTRFDNREDYILATVLAGRQFCLEPNKFPYDCPRGVQHWTLWSREELTEQAIEEYVEDWLLSNLPNCVAWGYDDNGGSRSFDVEHVHCYFQTQADGNDDPSRGNPESPGHERPMATA